MKKIWVAVAKSAELLPQSARVVRAAGLEIALVRTADALFALDNSCSHSGGPLGEGLVQGNTVTCPLHGWQFDCASGKCLSEKRAPQRTYAVKVEKGAVWVETPEASAAAEPHDQERREWIPADPPGDLAPGVIRTVRAGGTVAALVSTSGGVSAFENTCPHQGGPLGEGSLEGSTLVCPWHGYKFDCKSGECRTDARYRLRPIEAKLEQGRPWLRVAAAAAPPKESGDPATEKSPVEVWKSAKHGFDVWPDLLKHAEQQTTMAKIDEADLERMKWWGYFQRKNNDSDHYMCRVRIPGSEMTSRQARALAFVAYESGYSIADVTTRANIQIQGLTIEKLPGVRAALEKVGLTSRQSGHDNVRNVTSHPFSGIDPEELVDTRDFARAITDMVIGSREFSDLPRKFNVALTGRCDPQAHAWTQDISYVAVWGPNGTVGFQLLIGGMQGQSPNLAWHIPVFIRPEQIVETTAAIVRVFRELGYRHNRHQVRFRYLIERLGPDQVLVEIERRLGYKLEVFPKPAPKPSGEENFVGWFKQKQLDLWAVGICVPVGRLTWDQLEGLAIIAQQHGWGTLRTTYDQNLVIPGIPSAARQTVGYAIARHGLTFEPDPITRSMVACTGKQFCNIAVTETKGYAYQLIESLRRRNVLLHGINIHMSGCPSSCAMSYTADIGLKGGKIRKGLRVLDAFDVYLGGGLASAVQMGTLYKKLVPVDQLPSVIEEVVRDFYVHRSDTETFSAYWRNKLQGHRADKENDELPRWRCSRCAHVHVALDPPPFCPVCAALRARFEPAPDEEPAAPAIAPPKPSGRRILIVGGSIAGHTAAQTVRALDPEARITLVTDEAHGFYNRLNLTRFLSQEVERGDLFDYKTDWYERHQAELLTRTRVIAVNPAAKVALLAEGREIEFDSCILAHGSSANAPPFHRPALAGVYLLRTLEDIEGIIGRAGAGVRAAVIGGGVLGLEAAYGLRKRGAQVRIFEYLPHLMPRQLDRASASLLDGMLVTMDIETHAGVSVTELIGGDRLTGLALGDGRRFDADVAVLSTGIKPNIDWVHRSGIECNRGIVVDDRMQTSSEAVFAAGDVVEWRGQVAGLWNNAVEQAKVAAANAAGKFVAYTGVVPITVLKCLPIPLVSMGEIREDGGSISSKTRQDLKAASYRRVVFREGIPIGGILLGTTEGMGEMRRLVENGLELEQLRRKVVPDEVGAASA
jgi:ferredoxin-nitrite reductase